MSLKNIDFSNVPEDQAEIIIPPTMQWWRGTRQGNDVLGIGGFEVQQKFATIPNQPNITFPGHGDGYGFKQLSLAVMATAKSWYDKYDNSRVFIYDENRKVYSKFRVWAYIKELGQEFIITFSSTNGMAMEKEVLGAFKQSVIAPAQKIQNRPFPLWTFWCPVKAGPVKVWDQGSHSTPPIFALTPPFDEDKLTKLYVGDEIASYIKGRWEEAQTWAKKMQTTDDSPQQSTPEQDYSEPQATTPDEPPPLTEDEFPF